jgi:hypothetical protein
MTSPYVGGKVAVAECQLIKEKNDALRELTTWRRKGHYEKSDNPEFGRPARAATAY